MPEQLNQIPFSTKNYILNSLPGEDLNRLLPDFERIKLPLGEILYRHDDPIEYVYFPNTAMVSVIATTSQGQVAEVGVIGSEGMVGIDVLMGADWAFNQTLVQRPGDGLRIKTAAVQKEFKRSELFHDVMLRFTRLFMIQISQTALCNRLHTVEERLSRWLLLCHDRATGDELTLTQEFLSIMLGANRSTVTTAAITLQSGGFIKNGRGLITIIDREGLENFSCDCYQTVKEEYDRMQK